VISTPADLALRLHYEPGFRADRSAVELAGGAKLA
jgi:hypothetical protein